MKLIDSLNSPNDLRSLARSEVVQVAQELRDEFISTISKCGGHFASSLGAAEISVVVHYLFETPLDRVIWDVGHQAYIHKMLTGRREQLSSIRQRGGISGFLRRDESEYDAFGAGHAGTSISAGVGMAVALAKESTARFVVPIIGDGSMTCGMAFEALNHAGELGLSNLIVILNDNEMSISPNVGAHRWLFSRALTSKPTVMARSQIKSLYHKGYVPETVYKMFDRAQTAAQGFFSGAATLFESFRFRYIGPINGHSVPDLIDALEHAKDQEVPVLVHVRTTKGAGFAEAEEDPIKWHAVKPFKPEATSEEKNGASSDENLPTELVTLPPTYTQVFARTVLELMEEDPRIVAVTAAMAEGTGLDLIRRNKPDSFFDVGICEQHAVTFCAGLACEGFKPICAIYSTFLQRGYDQVLHDVCIQNLPVIFAMDRSGVVGNDGETHQGQFDIAFLRCIPNMVLLAPSDEHELKDMLRASMNFGVPVGIRYPRGHATGKLIKESSSIELGRGRVITSGEDVLLIGVGTMLQHCLEAAKILLKTYNLTTTIIDPRFIKPLDQELFTQQLPRHRAICTIEDHSLAGGFGSALLEFVNSTDLSLKTPIKRLGLKDTFIAHGTQQEQLEEHDCTPHGIVDIVMQSLVKHEQLKATGTM
jgi:1-deoxy-D-xylulose-5-phosphate synthase